jgi:hypothetical protein
VSGNATAFVADADAQVHSLVADSGMLFAGGWFSNIGGQPRTYVARLDPVTGAAVPSWNANADGVPNALLRAGNRLYVGGGFTSMGGQPRNNLAALELGNGTAVDWNPGTNGTVVALALSGPTLYAVGGFSTVGGSSHEFLAAIATINGAALPWFPNMGGSSGMAVAANPNAVFAGTFLALNKFVAPPGVTGIEPFELHGISLAPVAPNPARGPMDIAFAVPRTAHVQVDVFDVTGRRISVVADQAFPAGRHRVTWNAEAGGGPAASGMYFIRMRAEGVSLSRKVILTR